MSISFQTAVLDALEDRATLQSTPPMRVIKQTDYANTGTLHVLHEWDEVVRVAFDFCRSNRATLSINHLPGAQLGGPSSPTMFHLSPSDPVETKRLLKEWADRIDGYRTAWRRDNA